MPSPQAWAEACDRSQARVDRQRREGTGGILPRRIRAHEWALLFAIIVFLTVALATLIMIIADPSWLRA